MADAPCSPTRRLRRPLSLVVAVLAVITLTSGCNVRVARLLNSALAVNESREDVGRDGLRLRSDLSAKAQAHAQAMAAQGRLYHSNLTAGLPAGWRSVGENVARADNTIQAHQALLASPAHRANMLSGDYRSIGVGVAVGRDGYLYVAHVFMG